MKDTPDDAGLDAKLERLVRAAVSDAPDALDPPFVGESVGEPRQRRGLLVTIAAAAVVVGGLGAVVIVNGDDDRAVPPIASLPAPAPPLGTIPDSGTTLPSTARPPTTTAPFPTTPPPATALSRPVVDDEQCTPVYAREVDVDGLTLFAHVSSDPVPVQVIGDPDLGPTGPFATVLRYPASAVLPPPPTEPIELDGDVYRAQIYDNGNGVMQWMLDDGTTGYLRSRGLDREALIAIATGLAARPLDVAVPGFDFVAPTNRDDLRLLTESLDSDVRGWVARSECRIDTVDGPSVVRVRTILGDPVLQFAGVIDRPPPSSVGRAGDAIVVIESTAVPSPTVADITDADPAVWQELLTRADQPDLEPGHQLAIDQPLTVLLRSYDSETADSNLILRLRERDGAVFLEVDTAQAVLHPDAALWVTTIEGRGGGRSTARIGGILGYRLGDAPLTGEVNVTIETVDLTDAPLQSTFSVRLLPS